MDQNTQKILLFEKIKKQAKWAPVDQTLLEDIIQEAWLLALEYAEKSNKAFSELSNTEIKYRCLEAARKVKPEANLSLEDLEYDAPDLSETSHPLKRLTKIESLKAGSEKIKMVEWILKKHPKLCLSQTQWKIYNELRGIPLARANLWRARYARAIGVTRQNIWNIERIVKQKARFANDLLELFNGDVEEFFGKYGKIWHSPTLIVVLRSIANLDFPDLSLDKHTLQKFRNNFEFLQDKFLKLGFEILTKQIKKKRIEGKFDSDQLSIAYHLVRRGVRINSEKAGSHLRDFYKKIPPSCWIINRFIKSCLLFTDERLFENDKEEIKYLIRNSNQESKLYATYILARHGGTSDNQAGEFLSSGGKTNIRNNKIYNAVKDIYNDLKKDRKVKLEINFDSTFLRLLLMLKEYPQRHPKRTKNTLLNISQMAFYSKDAFIQNKSEKLLSAVTK